MAELSPQAQAIVDAWNNTPLSLDLSATYRAALAAALRAAALYCKRDSAILLSLADELEGSQ